MNVVDELIEVTLETPDKFLIVRETLTRIGAPSKEGNKLWQSCHILHKRQKYYIVHFKELFKLDGKPTDIDQDDIARRNTIANALQEWKLVTLVDPAKSASPVVPIGTIKIISHAEKKDWILDVKYNIGTHKKSPEKKFH